METTDLSWLAAKQKRVKSWDNFIKEEIIDPGLRAKTAEALKSFSEMLLQVWENKTCTEADRHKIEDMERVLEDLNEEARLLAKPHAQA